MARVEIQAGACGETVTVDVSQIDDRHVQVVVHSECEQITDMNPDLACLQWKGKGHEVFKRMTESAVYQSAGKHIRHTDCPLPAAILRAIQVEVGMSVPRDISIKFVDANDT